MPTTALQPGDTGQAVKQLQDFLIAQGFMTRDQANTGYGTYGPQTTAAVLAFQKAKGVDYSTGPGFWGPRTIQAASQVTAPASTLTPEQQARYNELTAAGADPSIALNAVRQIQSSPTATSTSTPSSPTTTPTATASTGYTNVTDPQVAEALRQAGISEQQFNDAPQMQGPWLNSTNVQNKLSAIRGTTPTPSTATTGTSNTNSGLQALLNNPNLSADQKSVIQAIFNAVSTNDSSTAERIKSAMQAASEFSDPYFKAQIRLATDALDRGLSSQDGDLAFKEKQLSATLKDLADSTAASKDYLSFQHVQELKQLQQKLQTDLLDTQDSMAAAGFTTSTKRARTEQILRDQNAGLVESSNKTYGYQTGNLDRALASKSTDTTAQIENLRRLASEGKLDLLRQTEEKTGTTALANLGYTGLLGGVGGTIPRQQTTDALDFANKFVF